MGMPGCGGIAHLQHDAVRAMSIQMSRSGDVQGWPGPYAEPDERSAGSTDGQADETPAALLRTHGRRRVTGRRDQMADQSANSEEHHSDGQYPEERYSKDLHAGGQRADARCPDEIDILAIVGEGDDPESVLREALALHD